MSLTQSNRGLTSFNSPIDEVFNSIDDDFDNFLNVNGLINQASSDLFSDSLVPRIHYHPLHNLWNNQLSSAKFSPPLDVVDNDNSYNLKLSVPGVSKENIKVDFNKEQNELKIHGEIPTTTTTSGSESNRYKERVSGSFQRRLRLPVKLDGDNIKAGLNNGVLSIDIPKLESKDTSVKSIEIGDSGSWTDVGVNKDTAGTSKVSQLKS